MVTNSIEHRTYRAIKLYLNNCYIMINKSYLLFLYIMLNVIKQKAHRIPSPAKQDIVAYKETGIATSLYVTNVLSRGICPPRKRKKMFNF